MPERSFTEPLYTAAEMRAAEERYPGFAPRRPLWRVLGGTCSTRGPRMH